MNKELLKPQTGHVKKKPLDIFRLTKAGKCEEVAKLVDHLSLKNTNYVTRQTFFIDKGLKTYIGQAA